MNYNSMHRDTPPTIRQKKSNRVFPKTYYKQSYGHYRTEREAVQARNALQKEYPKKKIQVVREARKRSTWKKYCVCEYLPSKGQNKGKKSQIKGKTKKP